MEDDNLHILYHFAQDGKRDISPVVKSLAIASYSAVFELGNFEYSQGT